MTAIKNPCQWFNGITLNKYITKAYMQTNKPGFKQLVLHLVSQIPYGKVASYGQIALYAGVPRAARQVGWILNHTTDAKDSLPWWRVVNNSGRISIKGSQYTAYDQKLRLEAEGIKIAQNFTFNIENYRWHKQ